MAPLGDFACLSAKCQQDGAASTYELPINATRCPVCGSRRIRRLYLTAPGVLRSGSRDIQKVIDRAGGEMTANQDRVRDASIRQQKANAPMFAVPMKQLGATLSKLGLAATVNGGMINSVEHARPMLRPSEPIIPTLAQAGVRPQIALSDKTRIATDGTVVEGA